MYYRLTQTLADKGELLPITTEVKTQIKNKNNSFYKSVYYYNEKHKKIFDEKQSIAGITDVVTNELIFDIDHEGDLEKSRKDSIKIYNRLIKNNFYKESILISFSGSKGFHINVQLDEYITPKQHKKLAQYFAKDIEGFDAKVYNASRILRIPGTKHENSGLYKLPLQYSELKELSIEKIKETAKKSYIVNTNLKESSISKELKVIINKEKKEVATLNQVDYTRNPLGLSNWKLALFQGFYPPKNRSVALHILAVTLRSKGLSKDECYSILKSTNRTQSTRHNQEEFDKEELFNNVIRDAYSENRNGGTYSEDNFPVELQNYLVKIGVPRQNELNLKDIEDIDDVFNVFDNFATNIDKNTFKTGIKQLDDFCRITTSMLVGWLGAPGSAKTSALIQFMEKNAKEGEEIIFFSFDMGRPLIFLTLAEKHTKYTQDEIFEIFKSKNEEKKQEIKDAVNRNFANVKMCFQTSADVNHMRKYIEQYQNKTGKKIRMIVVDYLEKVVGPYSDPSVNAGIVAKGLQGLANDFDISVNLLLQPQKMVGTPADPIKSYRNIKGSSAIEQDCRVVISIYREGYNPDNFNEDHYITFTVLKNSMGKLGKVDCGWNGAKRLVYELEDIERQELEELRKKKQQRDQSDEF